MRGAFSAEAAQVPAAEDRRHSIIGERLGEIHSCWEIRQPIRDRRVVVRQGSDYDFAERDSPTAIIDRGQPCR